MKAEQKPSREKVGGPLWVLTFVSLLWVFRWLFPERTLNYTGPRAIFDAVFALGLLGLILLLAAGIGLKVLHWLKISSLSGLTKTLFSLAIGLGVLAYGVLALGLTSSLNSSAIYIWLGFAASLSWRELVNIGNLAPSWISKQSRAFGDLDAAKKGAVITAILIFGLSLIQALAPPWGYDALMYHLQAPRLFLEAGKISLLPDIWQANGPMTIEMLYTIGLAANSDVFAKLIHLTFTGLVVLGCFSLGRHFLGKAGGWLSAAVLLGIPIFPIWGTLAYADMALVFYELLAIYAIALWIKNEQNNLLVLAGLMMGWALGSKFTSLGLFAILGLAILMGRRGKGFKLNLKYGIMFGVTASLIASPWYLKNYVLAGNPIYPFVFGGPFWNEERLSAIMTFLTKSFGVGRSVGDYILLPFNIYSQPESFGTSFTKIDYPSFLFPLALLYPWARRYKKLDFIAGLILTFFVFWALGSQQTRFLLPIYPLMSIVVSLVLLWLGTYIKKEFYRRTIGVSLVGGFLVATLFYQVLYMADISPYPVVFGGESKQSFLLRAVYDYPSLHYAEQELEDDPLIMMMWDGQGYYCGQACIPDPDQTRMYLLTKSKPEPKSLARNLRAEGVTHILVDMEGLAFFLDHDPEENHRRAADYFFEHFAPICAERIFSDDSIFLYEITCMD